MQTTEKITSLYVLFYAFPNYLTHLLSFIAKSELFRRNFRYRVTVTVTSDDVALRPRAYAGDDGVGEAD